MREFSKVSPSLYNSERFRSLGRDYTSKHVYQYLITCPHGTSLGVFTLKEGYACEDLDMDLIAYRKAIDTLCLSGLIAYDEASKTVFIDKWLDHNPPTNPKHAIGMLGLLKKCGNGELFAKRFQELVRIMREKRMTADPSIRSVIDSLSESYPYPIDRVCSPETETETRQRLDLVDKTETRRKAQGAASSPPATLTGGGLLPLERDDPALMYEKLTNLSKAIKSNGGGASGILKTKIMQGKQ